MYLELVVAEVILQVIKHPVISKINIKKNLIHMCQDTNS